MLETAHILVLGALLALGYLVLHAKLDPREPPSGKASIPFIGHMLGMIRHGIQYPSMVAKRYLSEPIITVNLGLTKFYVVISPDLMAAVQRNSRAFSFAPLLDLAAERIAGLKGDSLHAFRTTESGGRGLVKDAIHASSPLLSGKSLDKLNQDMFDNLQPMIDELSTKDSFDLVGWIRNAMTVAGTKATYGPLNPFKPKEVQDAFWEMESNVGPLLMDFLPWLTASKAYKNREILASAFEKYYENNGHEQASDFIAIRHKVFSEGGLTNAEIGRNEASVPVAILSNSTPATFWVIHGLFSRPELLREVRQEVEENAFQIVDGKYVVDLSAIRDACPLLISTFHEIMRVISTTSPTRFVMNDTMLADKYFLKKGNIVLLPSQAIGHHEKAWGPSAADFNPRRFMAPDSSEDPEAPKTVRKTGRFMAFGVSSPICPGRHFAASEILGLACMLMMRFDFTPENGDWTPPPPNSGAILSATKPVEGLFNVKIKERSGFEGKTWRFKVTEGKGQFPLLVG